MKTPKIDLKELRKIKEENFKDRLEFLGMYADWVKKNPNKRWSSEQGKLIN